MRLLMSALLLMIPVLVVPAFAETQTLPTEDGTLDIKLTYDAIESGDQTRIGIDFINPTTQKIQVHIDYRVTVSKGIEEVFGPTPLIHTSEGSVKIPIEFNQGDGEYTMDIEVEGILFQPIPTETASFAIVAGSVPDTTQANTTQANTTQANTTQANTTQANTTQANTTQANTTQANTTQANTTQANTTQANTTQANTTQANTTQANTTQANTTQANTTQANTTQANTTQANTTQANTTQANTTQANTTQANTTQANTTQANTTQANTTQANTTQANTTQANTTRPDPPPNGGCLIATAAYGSELAPQVQQLRELRDNTVLSTMSGAAFMSGFNQVYYSFSPAIADLEREHPVFRETVRIVLTPMLASLSLLNHADIDSEVEMLGYGVSIVLLNLGMYVGSPVFGTVMLYRNRQKRSRNSVFPEVPENSPKSKQIN